LSLYFPGLSVIHIHTYTRTHARAHTHTRTHTHTHAYTHVHTYTHTHARTYTHTTGKIDAENGGSFYRSLRGVCHI